MTSLYTLRIVMSGGVVVESEPMSEVKVKNLRQRFRYVYEKYSGLGYYGYSPVEVTTIDGRSIQVSPLGVLYTEIVEHHGPDTDGEGAGQ